MVAIDNEPVAKASTCKVTPKVERVSICQVQWNPQFFVTFRCNVKWPEIKRRADEFLGMNARDNWLLLLESFSWIKGMVKFFEGAQTTWRHSSRFYIHNAIEENISVHVYKRKGGKGDYGNTTLGFNEEFTWKSGVGFGTQIVGEFWWGAKYTHISVYNGDVFALCYDGKYMSTQHCYWKVQTDGFYLSQFNRTDPKYWDRRHPW